MAARPRFDPTRRFVAALDLRFGGKLIYKGKPFPKGGLRRGQLKMMYDSRRINYRPEPERAPAT